MHLVVGEGVTDLEDLVRHAERDAEHESDEETNERRDGQAARARRVRSGFAFILL